MPSFNKTSVRDELNRLKTEFQSQSDAGALSNENRLLIESLFTLLELIVSIFLEKNTKKTDKNSSKPSSQTEKDESALDDHKGSKGKGKKEQDESAYNTRTTETVTISEANVCDVCGENLSGTPCLKHERRTKIDIIFEKVVEHVDAEIKACPACDSTVKGAFPVVSHLPRSATLSSFER